ncbi:Protein CBG26374 [Caenorhabditis briggsae]|uniref:Protein CBG26374 n=1 Tax=Caenorhabditis briggsae TaxID=6238 RepID=E3CTX8_CAEBR|nr:Protein CBG26374 [Caenorhabditis briggsae]CBX33021.1 Protein CBG26374 [Caenorhabditis briggsae]
MKKVKKEKVIGPVVPVSYNRSILAAFEKQAKGKVRFHLENIYRMANSSLFRLVHYVISSFH